MGQAALAKPKKKGKAPKKRAEQYQHPAHGDIGPQTPAQMEGARVVVTNFGGSRLQTKRRDHILDRMHRQGGVTARQRAAGYAYIDHWEQTRLSPEPAWTRVYVDNSARPGDVNVAQLEAKRRLAELRQWITPHWRWLVDAVCLDQRPIRTHNDPRSITDDFARSRELKRMLRRELDRLASALGH